MPGRVSIMRSFSLATVHRLVASICISLGGSTVSQIHFRFYRTQTLGAWEWRLHGAAPGGPLATPERVEGAGPRRRSCGGWAQPGLLSVFMGVEAWCAVVAWGKSEFLEKKEEKKGHPGIFISGNFRGKKKLSKEFCEGKSVLLKFSTKEKHVPTPCSTLQAYAMGGAGVRWAHRPMVRRPPN